MSHLVSAPPASTSQDFMAFLDLLDITNDVLINCDPHNRSGKNWRKGQAFMNALPDEYYAILTGSLYDPFYKNEWLSCYKALDYLLAHM